MAVNHDKKYYMMMINIAKGQLGWDDEFYREEFLVKHGAIEKDGRISATTMSMPQLFKAYQAAKTAGFKPKRKTTSDNITDWRRPLINKITALWCTLADAGVIHNRSSIAMEKWCFRITKKARLNWASAPELNGCIESLKAVAKREHVRLHH